MAENAKIAALRKGMSPTGSASGSGPQALNFAWMNARPAASAPFQFRPVGRLNNPVRQTMEVVPPVNPLDLLSRNLNRQMDFYNPHSGLPNPVAVAMQKIIDNYTPPENPENAWTYEIAEHPGRPDNGDVMQQPIEDVSPGQIFPQYDDTSNTIMVGGELVDARTLTDEQQATLQQEVGQPLQDAGIGYMTEQEVADLNDLLSVPFEPGDLNLFVPGYTPDPTPLPPEPIKPGSAPAEEPPPPAPVAAPAPPTVEPEPTPAPTTLQLAQAYEGLYPVLTAPALVPAPAPPPPEPVVVEPEPDLRTLIEQLVDAEPVYTPPAPAPEPPPPPPPEPVYVAPPPPAPAPEPVVEPAPAYVEPTPDYSVMFEQLLQAEPEPVMTAPAPTAPEPVVEAAPVAAEEPVVDPYIEQILALYEQLYAPVQQPQPVEEQQIDPLSLYQDWMLEVA